MSLNMLPDDVLERIARERCLDDVASGSTAPGYTFAQVSKRFHRAVNSAAYFRLTLSVPSTGLAPALRKLLFLATPSCGEVTLHVGRGVDTSPDSGRARRMGGTIPELASLASALDACLVRLSALYVHVVPANACARDGLARIVHASRHSLTTLSIPLHGWVWSSVADARLSALATLHATCLDDDSYSGLELVLRSLQDPCALSALHLRARRLPAALLADPCAFARLAPSLGEVNFRIDTPASATWCIRLAERVCAAFANPPKISFAGCVGEWASNDDVRMFRSVQTMGATVDVCVRKLDITLTDAGRKTLSPMLRSLGDSLLALRVRRPYGESDHEVGDKEGTLQDDADAECVVAAIEQTRCLNSVTTSLHTGVHHVRRVLIHCGGTLLRLDTIAHGAARNKVLSPREAVDLVRVANRHARLLDIDDLWRIVMLSARCFGRPRSVFGSVYPDKIDRDIARVTEYMADRLARELRASYRALGDAATWHRLASTARNPWYGSFAFMYLPPPDEFPHE